MHDKLAAVESRAAALEAKYVTVTATLDALKATINRIFDNTGCNTAATRKLLGDLGITESNVLQYLALIEQRASEIMALYTQKLTRAGVPVVQVRARRRHGALLSAPRADAFAVPPGGAIRGTVHLHAARRHRSLRRQLHPGHRAALGRRGVRPLRHQRRVGGGGRQAAHPGGACRQDAAQACTAGSSQGWEGAATEVGITVCAARALSGTNTARDSRHVTPAQSQRPAPRPISIVGREQCR